MNISLRVLSVGPLALQKQVREALARIRDCELCEAADYRELWILSGTERVDAAVLYCGLSLFELEEACRFIRRGWPAAAIILVYPATDRVDDDLYDDRIPLTDLSHRLATSLQRHAHRSAAILPMRGTEAP